jgi:multisubunit Na+/H+ antiporter MnhB subunit
MGGDLPILDWLLAAMLLLLGWRILSAPDVFTAMVLFITFGLVLALAWVRLRAPDIALAEAAVGAGLTGALLLRVLHRMRPSDRSVHDWLNSTDPEPALFRPFGLAASAILAGVLCAAVWRLPSGSQGLLAEVEANLPASGVESAVTAVLLNFRAYDTWLELGVLLLAAMTLAALGANYPPEPSPAPVPIVMQGLLIILVPLMVLTAGYLFWLGKFAAGGAFQAGVVLGAAGVLLMLGGYAPFRDFSLLGLRILMGIAFACFGAAGLIMLVWGNFLEFPPARAGAIILGLEALASLSIGAILMALFAGLPRRSTIVKKEES